jgi:hypothetical protein
MVALTLLVLLGWASPVTAGLLALAVAVAALWGRLETWLLSLSRSDC